jgi:hypothetical protein
MPKIAYVCEPCWENASDSACYADRHEVRVLPTGEWICNDCYDHGDWGRPMTDAFLPSWSDLPAPPEYRAVENTP